MEDKMRIHRFIKTFFIFIFVILIGCEKNKIITNNINFLTNKDNLKNYYSLGYTIFDRKSAFEITDEDFMVTTIEYWDSLNCIEICYIPKENINKFSDYDLFKKNVKQVQLNNLFSIEIQKVYYIYILEYEKCNNNEYDELKGFKRKKNQNINLYEYENNKFYFIDSIYIREYDEIYNLQKKLLYLKNG